ncbi:MAG: di-trans,poly-cis-decaprenylcistransferase [Anaerolineae bacterium]|nr:di-trans,poly-cis-decaprenylcistransferase [Anaerolineae bacterium]
MMAVPKHIAFIMDGNGRWAQQRGLPRSAGHKAGLEHIPDVLEICHDLGVQIVSAFAWSTENWKRPKAEVEYIVRSLEGHLPRFVKELHARDIRFVHSGSRDNLTAKALRVLDEAVSLTQNNSPWVFNLAFNYGGRAELVHVASELLAERAQPETISEATMSSRLWTAGLPDVDLVIRTGGDRRISNFMLWQSAYACIYVADAYWPDVARSDIEAGIKYYDQVMVKA